MSLEDARHLLEVAAHDAKCAAILSEASRSHVPPHDASDWILTMQFYVLCLHVRALARCRGRAFERHEDARLWLNTEQELLAICKAYRLMEEWSRDARYKGRRFRTEEIAEFNARFEKVRDHLLPLLQRAGIKSPRRIAPIPPERYPLG
jgi:hypothetical protein